MDHPALYVCKVGRCFIFLWVNDLLIFSAKDQMQPLVDKILTRFEGRDLNELSYVLGMEVIRDRSKKTITITLHYTQKSDHRSAKQIQYV